MVQLLDLIFAFVYDIVWIFSEVVKFFVAGIIGEDASAIFGGNIGLLILLTIIYVAWDVVSRFLRWIIIIGWILVVIRALLMLLFGI